jgi:hypothetical protein
VRAEGFAQVECPLWGQMSAMGQKLSYVLRAAASIPASLNMWAGVGIAIR